MTDIANGPEVFLVLPHDEPSAQGFVEAPWNSRWSRVEQAPAIDDGQDLDPWLMERFGPFLRLTPQMTPPRPVGASVGLLVSELDQLEMATQDPAAWAFVLFLPSRLACLDHLRMGRQTLQAARDLAVGDRITEADLKVVQGGAGLDAAHKSRVIGCGLCYPLKQGEEVTFGFLKWMEQTP